MSPEESRLLPKPGAEAKSTQHDGRRSRLLKRALYSASLADFRDSAPEQILGTLVANNSLTLEYTQRNAWVEEIQILKEVMSTYEGRFTSNIRFREWEKGSMFCCWSERPSSSLNSRSVKRSSRYRVPIRFGTCPRSQEFSRSQSCAFDRANSVREPVGTHFDASFQNATQ